MKAYHAEWVATVAIIGIVGCAAVAALAEAGKYVERGPHCVEWETRPIITVDPQTHKTVDVWVPVCTRFKAYGGIRKTT
jgi:hypothetical protein